jgi:4-amino-4-deoxy-L-arabinose transferase-like glycosyltransferase
MEHRFAAHVSSSGRRTTVLLLAGLLLCVVAVQLVKVARLYSANWDEAHHLYDGYMVLTRGDYRSNAEVPPLVKVAAALPLLRLHPSLPAPTGTSQAENAFLAGRAFVFGNGGDRVLFPARIICMVFSLAAAFLIFSAGQSAFGTLAGLCALFLFVFDPNVLAHGALISTDMASAGLLLAGVYAFYRFSRHPGQTWSWRSGGKSGWGWLLATGLLAGLAMVAKFTGILIAPMLLLVAVAEGVRQRTATVMGQLLAASLASLACAWLVIWLFYGFRYAPAPPGLELSPSLGSYIASLPKQADAAKLGLLARFHLLPQAYIWGLADTKHKEWEFASYFLGRVYRHGRWLYFPLAFLIKSTLPLLILLLLSPFALRRSNRGYGRELIFFLVPVGVYFTVITLSHFDIGARHLMPVYPFLYLVAGAAAALLLRRGRGWAAIVVALLAWQTVTTVRVAPNYMAYGNEAWGGPLQVRRYLSDANVDWGQQLKTVKRYLDQNQISDCWFAYFPDGAVQPRDYGISCKRLPTPSGLWWFNLPMTVPPRIEGTVLISESVLDGVESGDGVLNPYDGFRELRPAAILADGVYVYRGSFPVPLASAWVDVRDSGELAGAGQVDRALDLAQQAASLASDSPRVQLQLANVLAAQQRWQPAADHYQLAEGALLRERPDLQAEELGPLIEEGLRRSLSHR